jgi:hypothetical protein
VWRWLMGDRPESQVHSAGSFKLNFDFGKQPDKRVYLFIFFKGIAAAIRLIQ